MALPQRRVDGDSNSLTTEVRWGWSSGMSLAAIWGQLRAWASFATQHARTCLDRPRPGALLEALDRYARRHSVGRMPTLVYAQLGLDAD